MQVEERGMTDLEARVADAERAWNASYLAGDVATFGGLLDERFLYCSERGIFAKADYVANLASGVIEMRGLETIESTARSFGDVVIVTGVARLDASFQGTDISGSDRYTRVWRLGDDGQVRAVSQHANAVPVAD